MDMRAARIDATANVYNFSLESGVHRCFREISSSSVSTLVLNTADFYRSISSLSQEEGSFSESFDIFVDSLLAVCGRANADLLLYCGDFGNQPTQEYVSSLRDLLSGSPQKQHYFADGARLCAFSSELVTYRPDDSFSSLTTCPNLSPALKSLAVNQGKSISELSLALVGNDLFIDAAGERHIRKCVVRLGTDVEDIFNSAEKFYRSFLSY